MCAPDDGDDDDNHGGISHEKREYHVVHIGVVHIGNDSRCMYRPCGGGACQKASGYRLLVEYSVNNIYDHI